MKSTMLKPHDRLISKLAIIGMFGALLTGCGNQDATSPKSYDIYGPRITLNNPGADAIVQTNSGPKHIPHEDLCYMIDADCIAKTDDSLNIVHYLMLDSHEDINQVISIKSENYTDIELDNNPDNSSTDEFIFLPQDVSKKKLLHIDLASKSADVVVFDSTGNSFTYTYSEAKDIPLTTLEGVDLTVINKIKLVGSSVANTKNLYFHGQKIPQSLNGNITGYFEKHNFGESYTHSGATARDVYDGHVNVETDLDGPMIGPSTELGTYTISYSAEDSSGNKSKLDRVVEVIDNEPPVVRLTGDAAIVLGFNSAYTEAGASASDIVDGDDIELASITYQKEENGAFINVESISTSVAANYQVIYEFADAAGNTSTSTRSVKIAPPQGETITILKDGVLGSAWDSGIQAFDQDLAWGACLTPAGCPNIDWGFVEDDERGSVLEITHADTSAGAGVFISSSDPIDIRDAEEDGFIKLDLKVVEGDQTIIFKADCGYPCGGGDQYVDISELNKWQTVIVPVKSLIPNGPSGNVLDLEILKGGLVIQALSAKATTFRIDNAYYDCRAATCAGISVPFVPVDWEANHEDPNDQQAFVAPTSYPGYALAWSDEFDGNSVNSDNWSFDIGNGDNGWGNGELQYYREDNASVDDGLLIIEAQKHVPPIDLPQKTGNRFTSSKLISEDKVEFKYGRVDIRAVVAEGQGMWSAGWMLGANTAEIGWPYSGEIDIFDTIGGSASKHGSNQEGMIVNNMYWNSTGPDPTNPMAAQGINNNGNAEYRINSSNQGETFSNRFHVFSLIWDEDNIKFEVDGVNTGNDVALVGALAETYRNPFFLILNVAVGGAWPKSPDTTTDFPDGMLVDYVRVYQTDSDGDGIADFELDGETPLDNCYGCYEDLDAPFFTSSPTPSIEENIGENQVVYTAVASDDFVVTYSLQAGHDSGLSIDASTGEVSLDVNPDSYTKNEYSFTVVVTDSSDNSSELAVTLTIIEIDDVAPVITSALTATSIEESSGAGQVIYTVISDDAEATYSLETGSDSALAINATTGDVTLTANPVYSTKSTYSFAVIATDALGNASDAQSVTLMILEVAGGNTLPTTGNLVTDGTFDQATSTTWTGVYNPIDGVNEADVEVAGNPWDVNLSGTVNLTAGADYTLSFDVSGGDRTIIAGIGQSSDPWFNNTETVTLSAASQTMVLHLTAKADGVGADFGDATSRVIFDMGADAGAVSIDNVSLVAGHIGTVNLGAGNDTGGDTPPAYGRQGPLDMTGAYGNGAISGDDGEFFMNDSSMGAEFAGFASLTTELYPFEFGTGGTLEFTASVPPGESVDVSFQLQKQGSDSGLLCDIGPVWNSDATTVSSANAQTFTIEIPAQGGDTFSNMIMELSADDINVKITDVYVTTSEKTDAEQTVPAQCDGSLDMTGAYGDGAVSGEQGEFFINDTSTELGFSGFANTTLDVYPFEFGSGGTLEFTASVPEGQSTTAVDVNFQFQKQGSDTGKFCDIAPIWEAPSQTVSGPVDQPFTIAIPSQGGNTFSNLIMELSVDDVNVKITGVKVTPSDKTADAPTVPEICVASPFPSVYPVDGLNSAAMFNGTFDDEEGGLATIQYEDTFEFPTGSAVYGGWSNSNKTLYPIEFTGGGFFAQKKIYFCASTTEAATVYFRFENEVYPANSTIYNTANVSLITGGVMNAYEVNVPITYAVNSLLFLMLERDTAITMGKVMGNWNGLPTQNITTDTDGDGVVDYCEDFPNDTPDWVDTDNDGASDEVDAFPDDATQWEAATP